MFQGKWLKEVVVNFLSAQYVPYPLLVFTQSPSPKASASTDQKWLLSCPIGSVTDQPLLQPSSSPPQVVHRPPTCCLEIFALELRPQTKGEVDHKHCCIQKLKQHDSSEASLGQNYLSVGPHAYEFMIILLS